MMYVSVSPLSQALHGIIFFLIPKVQLYFHSFTANNKLCYEEFKYSKRKIRCSVSVDLFKVQP